MGYGPCQRATPRWSLMVQSLMDLLRRRKRYTEPEARSILVQIIGACQYMHQVNVIHRDLKLGNLFLNENMDIKVGDLGLAALIEKPGDRKKWVDEDLRALVRANAQNDLRNPKLHCT